MGHTVALTMQPKGSGKGIGKLNRKVRERVSKTHFSEVVLLNEGPIA